MCGRVCRRISAYGLLMACQSAARRIFSEARGGIIVAGGIGVASRQCRHRRRIVA
jgi:hypothetical protein